MYSLHAQHSLVLGEEGNKITHTCLLANSFLSCFFFFKYSGRFNVQCVVTGVHPNEFTQKLYQKIERVNLYQSNWSNGKFFPRRFAEKNVFSFSRLQCVFATFHPFSQKDCPNLFFSSFIQFEMMNTLENVSLHFHWFVL